MNNKVNWLIGIVVVLVLATLTSSETPAAPEDEEIELSEPTQITTQEFADVSAEILCIPIRNHEVTEEQMVLETTKILEANNLSRKDYSDYMNALARNRYQKQKVSDKIFASFSKNCPGT